MRNKVKLPTLLGIFTLVIGVAAGVFLVKERQTLTPRASAQKLPKNVRVTNISDTSATVSWNTDSEMSGFVSWGTEKGRLGETAQSQEENQTTVHFVKLDNLDPQKEYLFEINSGGETFSDNNTPWSFTTGPSLGDGSGSLVISGNIVSPTGQNISGALVVISAQGMSPLSTSTSGQGTWVVPLAKTRSTDLTSWANLNSQSLVNIIVDAGTQGSSAAQARISGANPTPAIVLGKTYNFTGAGAQSSTDLPEAEIGLPGENQNEAAEFDISGSEGAPAGDQVTLESIEEGEIITTTSPEFFGDGPAKTQLEVTIESEIVTDTIVTSANGSWKWSVPDNLEIGSHVITLKWRDSLGILHTLTRNFVVKASGDEPAFESTPSGQTASPTSTPRSTASPTPTSSASATPRESIVSTGSGIPKSGSLTPTLILSIMGVSFVAAGVFLAGKSLAVEKHE